MTTTMDRSLEGCVECGGPLPKNPRAVVWYGSLTFCSVAHRDLYTARAARL